MKFLERLVKKLIRVGRVKATYPERGTVRVQFDDLSGIQSAELQVLMRRTQKDLDYDMFEAEEQVLCLFLPIASTKGFVLGSVYTLLDVPGDFVNKKVFKFEDGTEISYDRSSQLFKLSSSKDINISAVENIDVSAKNISFTAEENFSISAREYSVEGENISLIASSSLSQESSGSFAMEAGASMTIKAPTLSVDAIATFAKPVTMSATATVSGAIAANGGISTPSSGDFDKHIHNFTDQMGSDGTVPNVTQGPVKGG